jgi:hypothetical protein
LICERLALLEQHRALEIDCFTAARVLAQKPIDGGKRQYVIALLRRFLRFRQSRIHVGRFFRGFGFRAVCRRCVGARPRHRGRFGSAERQTGDLGNFQHHAGRQFGVRRQLVGFPDHFRARTVAVIELGDRCEGFAGAHRVIDLAHFAHARLQVFKGLPVRRIQRQHDEKMIARFQMDAALERVFAARQALGDCLLDPLVELFTFFQRNLVLRIDGQSDFPGFARFAQPALGG